MKIIQFVKAALFTYEFIRIMAFISVLILQRNEPNLLVKMIFAAPSVLFPLMALFIWLDTNLYKAYLPLFIAGKCIGIFILLGWSIVFQQVTIFGRLYGFAIPAELLLLSGDFFALAAVLLIIKDVQKPEGLQGVMEEKECVLFQSQAEKAE